MVNLKKYNDRIVAHKVIPERKATYSPYPERLSDDLKRYLSRSGIKKLYSHQVEMFEKARDGNNIVITTSTASGKTLSFLLPIVEEILKDPTTRAIFIYPTKALASDQYRNLKPLLDYFGKNKIQAGVYDGDTPVNERTRIRNSANIILTNPEMINTAFLPNHNKFGFNFIFSNLKYVVIDELHTYRGTFGAHLSNLMKRLNRICKYYHTSPQYLCSSATIANPVELAEKITGKAFQLVDRDGSPSPEKHYYIWQPPVDEEHYRKRPVQEASDFIPELVMEDNSFIAFCKSRRDVEVVLKESRDKLQSETEGSYDFSKLISGYRGGYKPEERKEIEKKMVDGALRGLVSTNALELGIDIGSIDTTVIVGYPGTRASFWQQSGRAGRSGKTSQTFLILDNLPFDQYIAIDSEWLFSTGMESAVVDPNNLFIQLAHVRAAAAEIPFSLDDISIFPLLGEIIPVLMENGELREQNGKFAWTGPAFPAGDFSLRNMDKNRYKLINKENNELMTEMDELQAFREIHKGAIYLHDGSLYLVEDLDLENRQAIAILRDDNYYTVPDFRTSVKKIKDFKHEDIGRVKKRFGDVNVTEAVVGYKRVEFHNHQNLGYEQLAHPLSKTYDTEGIRLEVPGNVVKTFNALIPKSSSLNAENFWKTYFGGMGYALLNSALMITMTTREDIGIAKMIEDIGGQPVTYICIFDRYIGGMGYAEKAYEYMGDIVKNAIKMINGCSCEEGCPICVGDYMLDKSFVVWGLENIWKELSPLRDVKIPEAPPARLQVEREREFKFENLEKEWPKFRTFSSQTGEELSTFIADVESIKTEQSTLILSVENHFIKRWIEESENKQQLMNIFNYYVETPEDFDIDFEVTNEQKMTDLEKVSKRYSDLVK